MNFLYIYIHSEECRKIKEELDPSRKKALVGALLNQYSCRDQPFFTNLAEARQASLGKSVGIDVEPIYIQYQEKTRQIIQVFVGELLFENVEAPHFFEYSEEFINHKFNLFLSRKERLAVSESEDLYKLIEFWSELRTTKQKMWHKLIENLFKIQEQLPWVGELALLCEDKSQLALLYSEGLYYNYLINILNKYPTQKVSEFILGKFATAPTFRGLSESMDSVNEPTSLAPELKGESEAVKLNILDTVCPVKAILSLNPSLYLKCLRDSKWNLKIFFENLVWTQKVGEELFKLGKTLSERSNQSLYERLYLAGYDCEEQFRPTSKQEIQKQQTVNLHLNRILQLWLWTEYGSGSLPSVDPLKEKEFKDTEKQKYIDTIIYMLTCSPEWIKAKSILVKSDRKHEQEDPYSLILKFYISPIHGNSVESLVSSFIRVFRVYLRSNLDKAVHFYHQVNLSEELNNVKRRMCNEILQEIFRQLELKETKEIEKTKELLLKIPEEVDSLPIQHIMSIALTRINEEAFVNYLFHKLNIKSYKEEFLISLAMHGKWEWLGNYINKLEFINFKNETFLKALTSYATTKESIVGFILEIQKDKLLPSIPAPPNTFFSPSSGKSVSKSDDKPGFFNEIDSRYHEILWVLYNKYDEAPGDDIAATKLNNFRTGSFLHRV